ncbi:MAG: acriflavin resistance protein [Nitrospirae bacterium CG18_big_fil_WC_8_21_14_2_50_70_55]|nr:efflux RND transporter permease subunit [Deltaproteobacteria bacterium]OIP62954.1 MAG: acriflavin resistance protein [Nitrospirae bacterium CG2_30_70_394]PIQ05709.1 MAG: acriflavin resistance protein [Nitrospirae bacterium CG18_big_fil_WC_8_21_14_2_50_70_55]PIU79522.1 MAG: AcrB/AcrD/AcrF family protein [Nitrospirae bacterium CG06_land_8_20_14_3_00_70_43]PIW83806.1 MAG: AcrB/AcrD/AcrF family protein [Nitrospirae bacterium CG_4_8_14_3_um_filter_70_85]PIX82213.1 MAG: AcrB/AcrD/AcrF family prot
MNQAIRWMAANHVAANLLMLVFVIGGLIIGQVVRQEVFPEVSLDMVQVTVPYPGATPEDAERGICLPVEEAITGVEGIKEVASQALEGGATITATVSEGENADLVLADVKNAVDRLTTLPEEAEEPIVSKLENRRQVISVVVYGNLDERTLREQVEAIRDDLLALPEITQTDLSGVRPYEIAIEISETSLRRYGLTLDEVATRVRHASLDLPGGTLRAAGGEILVRTPERRDTGAAYGDIVVIAKPDGTRVRLSDLGQVRDTFRETDTVARFDGLPAAMVDIYRVGDQTPVEISRAVHRYLERKRGELPATVHVATWDDRSEVLRARERLLLGNAISGLVLVFLCLGLFLELRLALWVMLGIPVSFLGALLLMPALDVSINMISLFAFIMALGIVVDDAIVIGENVYDHRHRDKPYPQAAADGTVEVGLPVVFSALTTVAAFVPLAFVQGMLGKFIGTIPMVVVPILLVSLTETLFVLPSHLSIGAPRPAARGLLGAIDRLRRHSCTLLDRFVGGPYQRFLVRALDHRYTTVAIAVAILLLTIGTVRGGLLRFTFMPEVDGDVIQAALEMPVGTPATVTDAVAERIAAAGRTVVAEYDRPRPPGDSILRHLYAVVGGSIGDMGPVAEGGATAGHRAAIAMFLQDAESRGVPAKEISDRWRARVGEIAGVRSLSFSSSVVHMGANIDIQLAHTEPARLDAAAAAVQATLAPYPGVHDIATNAEPGKREIRLHLRPAARALGVSESDLGHQVRAAFYGAEALRFERGRNEVRVMVRYPEGERQSIADLERLRIRTPAGGEMELGQAAEVSEGTGYSVIHRWGRKRVINITAAVDSATTSAAEVIPDLKARLLTRLVADDPGLSFDLEGEQKEQRDSMTSMRRGFALALFAIYALIAIPLRSYLQPLLIMVAIPFSIVGAVLGHLLMGFNLSMLSIFGIVALSGVVANDAILLIDTANHVGADRDTFQAMVDAAMRRFRPILLTSITTFFGLAPIILQTSVQARFLIPMAISLGFGILFATVINLLLVPALAVIAEDVQRRVRRQRSG